MIVIITKKRGYTLLELVVVLAIIGILVGFAIPAIQKVREAGIRTNSMNKLRQINLGLHNYVSAHHGKVPGVVNALALQNDDDKSALLSALEFIDGYVSYQQLQGDPNRPKTWRWIRLFYSPSDPTIYLINYDQHAGYAVTSYSQNMYAFDKSPTIYATFSDGTSNTICFAERYAIIPRESIKGAVYAADRFISAYDGVYGGPRRCTFADLGWNDIVPITTMTPPSISLPSVPGVTFQHNVKPELADHHQLQGIQSSGLLVSMFDASVRVIGPTVSEKTFWAAITPNGNEVLDSD